MIKRMMMAMLVGLALSVCAAERGVMNRPRLGDGVVGEQYLLTIGIDEYLHWPKLECAVRDAKAVRDVLVEQYGFEKKRVVQLYNADATERGITKAFRKLGKTLHAGDSLLIFYAGHGKLDDFTGEGAWVPVEGDRDDDSSWIRCGRIKSYLRGIDARHVFLISDSCFAGDFFRGSRGAPPEISDAYVRDAFRKTSRQALTSGDLEPVVDAGFGGHSVFTHFLLKELKENTSPYLLPSDLHSRIKGGVSENARQRPKLGTLAGTGGEELGEFVLFREGVGGSMDDLIARKQEALERLQAMEDQARRAAELAREVESEKQKELDALDSKIKRMQAKLEAGDTGGDALKELVALVRQQEEQDAALKELKRRKAAEERKRSEEIERLRKEQAQQRRKAFDADYADYRYVVDSRVASTAVKQRAWDAICKAWSVKGGGEPGALKWNAAEGRVELTDVGALLVRMPSAGRLRLAGNEWSSVSAGKGLRWSSLPVGSYEVEAEIDGKIVRRTVEVTEKKAADVTITLEPQPGEEQVVDLGGGVKLEMVWVPKGSFMMGSPSSEDNRDDDERQHRVTLSEGFWMGKYEVTQEQWAEVMGKNPSHFSGSRNPVEKVSWEDCQAFIQKLNAYTGGRAASRAGAFSLPTEAQWEYACRAGTTTPFHYGGRLDSSMANFDGNYPYGRARKGQYREQTVRVGSFKPNAWGLYDMHGNVWEWCQDWYDKDYPSGSVTDPSGASSGSGRVLRGGSWHFDAWNCRSAHRYRGTPTRRSDSFGFRLVLCR